MSRGGKLVYSEWVNGVLVFKSGATGAALFSIGPGGAPRPALVRVDIDAQSGTITAANMVSGLIVHTSVTGAGTITTDTGTNIDAAFPGLAVGDAIEVYYVNDGTQTVTLTGASGCVVLSAQTIATLQGRKLTFVKLAANSFNVFGS